MDEQPVATVDNSESEIAFRLKTTIASLTFGMLCREYWPYYYRGLSHVVESIEMFAAKRVSRNFVARCGMRLVTWADENNYATHSLLDIISDYEADDAQA